MIFRFPDNKGLTFAYAELLAIGIPESSITACFDESVGLRQPRAVHQSFLQHLHSWFVSAKAHQDPEGKIDPPGSPLFRTHHGTLEIKSTDRAVEIIGVAAHHYGEMVG